MIGELSKSTSFGTGIESQFIGFVVYTLRPLIKKLEQELERKIIRNPRYYAEFIIAGLLRGDTKARSESYQMALGGNQMPGFLTVNEVRKLENFPPIGGGNELYKPLTAELNDES
jgi:HK97 family phage portal protein